MTEAGDRIVVESERTGQPARTGVVTAVHGSLITIDWDDGGESSMIPSLGSMHVVGREEQQAAPNR